MKFIPPYADTPNLLRLYYSSPTYKKQKKTYGYKLLNNHPMSDELFHKKHRQTQSYIVNPEKKSLYSLSILKGKCLKQFE